MSSFLKDYAKSKNRELFKKAVNAFIDDTGHLAKIVTSNKGKPAGEAILELLMPKLYKAVLEIRNFEQEEFERKQEEKSMGIKLKPKKKNKAAPAPWVNNTPPAPFDWDSEEKV